MKTAHYSTLNYVRDWLEKQGTTIYGSLNFIAHEKLEVYTGLNSCIDGKLQEGITQTFAGSHKQILKQC